MNKSQWQQIIKSRGITWMIQSGKIGIILTDRHCDYPGIFVMHCGTFNIHAMPLNAKNPDDAKAESLQIIKQKLDDLNQDFQNLFT